MKTAAVYIRVSTEDQTEHSPESQLTEIKKYAKRHDMIIDAAHIYTDAGISGRTAKKRPQFQKMISVAKTAPCPFDVILVWKFSRFARNQEESILYKSLLRRESNVEVVSITEETGDSMFGPLIERIIEWMDEFYSIRLSEEVRTKMTLVSQKGRVQTGAPFGYQKTPGEEMVIVPDEAEWIRYIFRQFVSGKSMLSIAKELNAHGVRTHRGNRFENRTIDYILHNPMYIGCTRWTPTGKTLSKRIFDSEDTIIAKGTFEPIISDDLFRAAAERLTTLKKSRKPYAKPQDVRKHWLSGLVKCSSCGATLTYSPANNGFQCYKYAKGICKDSHYISAPKLEAAVIDAISQVTVTEQFIRDNTPAESFNEPAADYTAMLSRLERMLERAKLAYVEGIDTIEEYSANKNKIMAEIDEINALQREAENKKEYLSKEEVESRLFDIISLLKSDTGKDEKYEAISSSVENIEFSRVTSSIRVFFRL